MNDLRLILSRPLTIRLPDGREVRSAPLDLDDHGDLQAWIDSQQVSAFDAANREIARGRLTPEGRLPYPIDIQKFLLDRALTLDSTRRVELGSPEADRILESYWGKREQIRLSLRKGTPGISEDEIREVFALLGEEAREAVVAQADVVRSGRPKAGAGNGSPATTPPTAAAPSTGGPSSAS